MTTIAYNHNDREIAVDGRISSDGIIDTDAYIKKIEKNGVAFYLCGCLCDYERLVDAYFSDSAGSDIDASALVVDNGSVYDIRVSGEQCLKTPIKFNTALGSGAYFAMAAMDHGKSAKEAIEYAATRDTSTGGKIICEKVDG